MHVFSLENESVGVIALEVEGSSLKLEGNNNISSHHPLGAEQAQRLLLMYYTALHDEEEI